MNHPRARVMHEERGRVFPPWVFRTLWPAMIPLVRWLFAAGLRRHQQRGSSATLEKRRASSALPMRRGKTARSDRSGA